MQAISGFNKPIRLYKPHSIGIFFCKGLSPVLTFSSLKPRRTNSTKITHLHGVWQLVRYEIEVKSSGTIFEPMGKKPTGVVIFTTDGHVSFTLTAEGRKPRESKADSADLLNSVIAYTGTYRLEADQWITKVHVAWNPEWVGTEQTRYYRIEQDQLNVQTPWRVMPNWTEQGLSRSNVTFRRC